MTALEMKASTHDVGQGRLDLIRAALTGSVVLAVLFTLCWVAAAVHIFSASHMYVSLFTIAPIASFGALAGGICWSVLFGALAGGLIAATYNALGFLARRAT